MRLITGKKSAAAIFFIFLGFASASGAESAKSKLCSNSDNINVRSDSTISSSVICLLNKGESIEVVSERFDWYKIRLPKHSPCYIRKDLTSCIERKPAEITPAAEKNVHNCISIKVTKQKVNIRLGPSESSPIIGRANQNEVLSVVAEAAGWYRIEPPGESFGWVNKQFFAGSACLKVDEPAQPKKEENALKGPGVSEVVIEGIVKPYGKVLWRPATHKLLASDNKEYLLKGNKSSLDSLNQRKVKVCAKIIGQEKKNPILEVKTIELID